MTTLQEIKEAKAGQVSVLLEASRAIDSTLMNVPVKDIQLTVDREEMEMMMSAGGQEWTLTPRALKNVAKLTRAPVSLMFNQSDPTLNAVFQRQLAELNSITVLRDPSNMENVISMFRMDTYQPYETLLGDIKDDIIRFSGDILESDSLTFQTGVGELPDTIVYGANFTISANQMVKSSFSSGLYRLICSNGAVNKVFGNASMKDISPTILQSLVREFEQKRGEYEASVGETLEWMRATPVNRTTHWHALEQMRLPKRLVDKYKEVIATPAAFGQVLHEAKASGVETIYDSFNILTHLAKDLPLLSARSKLEAAAFEWASDLQTLETAAA
jgi:hypothetical protein